MKSEKRGMESEALEMFSACNLVNDLMRRDGLGPDEMMKKTGMPKEHIVAILEGNIPITPGNASLFQRCLGWRATLLLDAQLRDRRAMAIVYLREIKSYLLFLKMLAEVKKLKALVEKKYQSQVRRNEGSL